jgi:nicotinamidase-related amidase
LIDREAAFADGMWGGERHPELAPRPGDVVIQPHWGQSGFANTDLDVQLKQRGIEKISASRRPPAPAQSWAIT